MNYLNVKSETQLICHQFQHTMSNISYDAGACCERRDEKIVQFSVNTLRTHLWVNSEQGCLFRASRIETLTVLELDTSDICTDTRVKQIYFTTIVPPTVAANALLQHKHIVVHLGCNAIAIASEHGRLLFVESNDPIEYTAK